MNVRIPFVVCGLFLLALVISLMYTDTKPIFFGLPFALFFDISISFVLFFYFCFEAYIAFKSKIL